MFTPLDFCGQLLRLLVDVILIYEESDNAISLQLRNKSYVWYC